MPILRRNDVLRIEDWLQNCFLFPKLFLCLSSKVIFSSKITFLFLKRCQVLWIFEQLGLWSKNKMRLHIWVIRLFSIKYCFKKLVFAVPFSKHLQRYLITCFLVLTSNIKVLIWEIQPLESRIHTWYGKWYIDSIRLQKSSIKKIRLEAWLFWLWLTRKEESTKLWKRSSETQQLWHPFLDSEFG